MFPGKAEKHAHIAAKLKCYELQAAPIVHRQPITVDW